MKKFLKGIINGGSSLTNGFAALAIISLIVLGCTCNQKDGFKLGGKNSNTAQQPAKDDNPFGDKRKETFSEDKIPSDDALQEMTKTTLLSFNDAVQAGDFADFHKTISKSWRRSSRPSVFEKAFKEFIDKKISIGKIRSMKARFAPSPRIDDAKYGRPTLMLEGRYSTRPLPVNFELNYILENEDWKLAEIKVNTNK